MQSRSEKWRKDKETRQKKVIKLKIMLLAILIVAAFAYLIHWIDATTNRPLVPDIAAEEPPGPSPSVPGQVPEPVGPDEDWGNTADPPGDPEAVQDPEPQPLTEPVRLAFVGDVMFAGNVEVILKDKGFDHPYKYVKPYLEKADITVANLETPITTQGTPEDKQYVYQSSPEALIPFKEAGFDLVGLANNHILDYGHVGLLDTLQHLKEHDIPYVGAGRNADEAYAHVLLERQGMKIAFLSFSRVAHTTDWFAGKSTPGVAQSYDPKLALEAVARAREEADLVVVLAHWGKEREEQPVKEQVELAYQYIDAGADLVVGSHPHVVQGFEQYKGKWIAYSLGNFIFTTNNDPNTWESLILEAACNRERHCELSLTPILTKAAQPIRMLEEDGLKLFEKLTRISPGASVDAQGKVSASRVKPIRTIEPSEREETSAPEEGSPELQEAGP